MGPSLARGLGHCPGGSYGLSSHTSVTGTTNYQDESTIFRNFNFPFRLYFRFLLNKIDLLTEFSLFESFISLVHATQRGFHVRIIY